MLDSVKETHQMAEANQEKNMKMREALGISQYFVEGSSLDPARKAKEAAAAAAEEAKKKYTYVYTVYHHLLISFLYYKIMTFKFTTKLTTIKCQVNHRKILSFLDLLEICRT